MSYICVNVNQINMKGYGEIEEKHLCLECGGAIEYYRKGKIFCDELCRSRYHNKAKNWKRHYHAKVIGILERNYSILQSLEDKQITNMDIGDLIVWGYNIEYATSIRRTRNHLEYRCFEYKFYRSDNRIFGLERITPEK